MAAVLSLAPFEGAPPETDPVVLRKARVRAPAALRGAVQRTMSADCGVVRAGPALQMASETLADLARLAEDLPAREIATYEVINILRVSRAIVAAARAREESRGAHTRSDAPDTDDAWLGRLVIQGDAPPRFVELAALARGQA
jgi:L-aspartate oxidase